MRKITKLPVDGPDWQLIGFSLCHANIKNDDLLMTYLERIGRNCVGLVSNYSHATMPSLTRCEFNFFDRGVVLKMWGFEEDFKNNFQKVAMLHDGEWLEKEDEDDFMWGAHFSRDLEVEMFWIGFSNRYREIRVEITPG